MTDQRLVAGALGPTEIGTAQVFDGDPLAEN